MLVVMLEPFTKCVKSIFSCFSLKEPVLWTFSPACKVVLASLAVKRECISFIQAKLKLFWATVKSKEIGLEDITQLKFRIDKMIAGINITIMFYYESVPTGFGIDT